MLEAFKNMAATAASKLLFLVAYRTLLSRAWFRNRKRVICRTRLSKGLGILDTNRFAYGDCGLWENSAMIDLDLY